MMYLIVNITVVDFIIKMLIQIHDSVSNYYYKIMINMMYVYSFGLFGLIIHLLKINSCSYYYYRLIINDTMLIIYYCLMCFSFYIIF